MNENLVTDAKFAFVVAERQKNIPGVGVQANWQEFLKTVADTAHPPVGTQTIHENIWLIPLATGLPFVSELIRCSGDWSVSIRILFLAQPPVWIKYPPDAKSDDGAKLS